HDGAPRANAHDGAALVDVAVLPVALQQLACLGVAARRIARRDADNAAARRLLAHELVEAAIEHEAHTLLARRELERPRERGTVAERTGADHARAVVHLYGRERARTLGILAARILERDGAGLHVGLIADDEETNGTACARHTAARVRAVDAREPHVVIHEE